MTCRDKNEPSWEILFFTSLLASVIYCNLDFFPCLSLLSQVFTKKEWSFVISAWDRTHVQDGEIDAVPILLLVAWCNTQSHMTEQNGQCTRVHSGTCCKGAQKFWGRKISLNRTVGLHMVEGTMPGAAKIILCFKDSLLIKTSSDPQFDFVSPSVLLQETDLEGADG